MSYSSCPLSLEQFQSKMDATIRRLEIERQLQMMGAPKENIIKWTQPNFYAYSPQPHLALPHLGSSIDRINRIYFPYEKGTFFIPKKEMLPPLLKPTSCFSKQKPAANISTLFSSFLTTKNKTPLQESLLNACCPGLSFAKHVMQVSYELIHECSHDTQVNQAYTQFKLKDFPGGDEAILRIPFETNSEGFPCAKPPVYYEPSQIKEFGEKNRNREITIFINGILNSLNDASKVSKKLSDFKGGAEVCLVYNSTLGLQRDVVKQKLVRKNYLMPAGKLLREKILQFFKNADPNQVMHVNAHSQGGAILFTILPDIPIKFRKRMYIDTYGTATFIPANMAKQVRNYWHPKDYISKYADRKGWLHSKNDGSLYILPKDQRGFLNAHTIDGGYNAIIKKNAKSFFEELGK